MKPVGPELDPNCFQRLNATSKLLFLRDATRIQNSLNPVQTRQDVRPDLDQSCFQMLSADEEALAIRRLFSLVDMITKAKFSNSHNDIKVCLFG